MTETKPRLRHLLPTLSGLLILLALGGVAAYGYFGAGLRAYVVETPSMGTYAPVGTLVISQPTAKAPHVGDTILFHPAGQGKTYFHRVLEVKGGAIFTAGDLTHEQDPWMLNQKEIVGAEALHIVNAGWLFKGAPVLLLGLLLLWIYVRFFAVRYWKIPSIFFGLSTIASVLNYMFHPFVQASLLDKSISAGIATIRFVNTGILPLDVKVNGRTQLLAQGELFVSHSSITSKGTYAVSSLPHVEWWTALIFGAVVAAPSLVGLICYVRNRRSADNWYYVPSKRTALPEGYVLDVSDQVLAKGKVYPRYISADYDPDEEAETWHKTLAKYAATTDSR